MCGIAGWYDRKAGLQGQDNVIKKMSESMERRGPDDSGIYQDDHLCLMHRRLAVIDPENGAQPMTAKTKGRYCTIVYNGEIYNTKEVQSELIEMGYRFHTHSDTECVLLSYLCWGSRCVEKLNGIFAFAVYDHDRGTLFLARDRVGVKPLFYYQYANGLLFASEIQTLLKNPLVRPVVAEEGLCELFLMGPGRTQGQGIIRGVQELLPGEYAFYDGEKMFCHRYFTLRAKEHTSDLTQSIREVRELVTDSIERQLVSDVPLFCFLSGGLDSSIISYTAAQHRKRNGEAPIDTYSVDYHDNDKYFQKSLFQPTPDSEFIGIMTDAIHSNHHAVEIDNTELFYALTKAVDARSLPGMTDVDASLLLFCERIRQDFKVGLSGECADELFGGYPWYHDQKILFEDTFPWSRSLDIRRMILKDGFLPKGEEYVRQRYADTCRQTEKLRGESALDSRMREMFSLNFYWFMQTLLDRKDRMSMYHGMEVRVPFCDHRIVEYAYNLPWSIKACGGREKGILREAFRGLLPDSIIDRKKSPYPKTHHPLYFRLCAEKVREILHDKTSPLYDILNKNGVETIIEHPEKITSPWYGQLMKAPQILAYIIQLDHWFRTNHVTIE